ncbi:MAG: hypothetical protein IT161_05945 [Bryobacterales bacterium]|nr:hypothetical protein [Bryobacterales bacterium]
MHHIDREPPVWRRAATIGVLVLLIIGFYWKLVLTDEYTWLQSGDFANQVLPWFQVQASEWHMNRFPMWDPYTWLGQPLFGQAQPGAAYPPNWLFFNLNLKNGWIRQSYLHWYFVGQHIMAALFAFWLARDLGRSLLASVLAGCVFSLAAWMASTGWPQMVNGAVWAPIVFLFLMRVWRRRRPLVSAAWGGFFLGFAWLSGHHQVPIYLSLAAAGVWLYTLFRNGLPERKLIACFAVFWLLAGMAGAFQILPAYEYGKLSVRWVGVEDPIGWDQKVPYLVHQQYSLSPTSLLGLVFAGVHTHSDPFIGVAVLLLCLAAVALGWAQREIRIFGAIALGGLLYGFAHHDVFQGILYAVLPVVDKARTPAMATILIGFGASVVAAFGLDRISSATQSRTVRNLGLAATAFGLLLVASRSALVVAKGADMSGDSRPMITMLAALLCGALLIALHRGAITARAMSVLLIGLFLIEVGNTNGYYLPSRFEKNRTDYLTGMAQDSDVVEFLRRQPGPIRVNYDDQIIPYNFGDWQGIETTGGYLASVTRNVRMHELHAPRTRQLLGVAYGVRKEPDGFHNELVFSGQSGHNVYMHRDVFPRAFVVHDAVSIPSRDHVGRMMNDAAFDLRRRTFMLGHPPELETCADGDSAQVIEHLPNRVTLRATLGCKGMVVLTDLYFPGWKATVDGHAVPIHEAYALVRGAVAGKGTHTIEFHYAPASVFLGGALSALALAACCVLTLAYRG